MDERLLTISLTHLPALARVGGILATAPLFSSSAVPRRVRLMFAIALTIGLAPLVGATAAPRSWGELVVGAGSEALIGMAIGLSMTLVFVAAAWAGELIAQQLGIGLAESYDPATNAPRSVLSSAYSLLALVVFLGINGHHALVRGIGASFRSLPVLGAIDGQGIVDLFARLLTSTAGLALQLAAPVFVTLLVADLTFGMVGKTTPQVGLMTAGIAVRAAVGLLVLVISMALTATLLQGASVNWIQIITSAVPGMGRP